MLYSMKKRMNQPLLVLNVIVVKAENADKEEYKKLVELYHDPEIQKWISEQFAGTKVEVSKPISEVWGK